MSYSLLKTLHISCAAISFTLFFLRGIWVLNGSSQMRQRWIKILPHLVDTVLLSSAILLAYTLGQYPFANGWLTAKLAALLLYIVLGSVALKYARSKSIRLIAWLAAQAVFGYIVWVAIHHNQIIFN